MVNLSEKLVRKLVFVLLWTLVFSFLYVAFTKRSDWKGLHEGKRDEDSSAPWFDYFYFSLNAMTTVGFGDIRPVTTKSRLLACAQLCLIPFLVLS